MRLFTLLPALAVVILFFPTPVRCQLTENWIRTYAATSAANAHLASDASGNLYLAGNAAALAYTLIKYNSTGAQQWAITGSYGSSKAGFGVIGVGTDNAGNVYLVSNEAAGILATAYNSSGTQLWSTVVQGNGIFGKVMSVNASGSVYIGGQITLATAGNPNAYLTVRVIGGVQKYLSTFEGSANQFSYVTGIACDASGNAYVNGVSTGIHSYLTRGANGAPVFRTDTSYDMTTIKYDSSGNATWTNTYNNGYHIDDYGSGVAVDPSSGNVYALGQSMNSTGLLGDLIAYSSSGAQLWIDQSSATLSNNSVLVDPSGNILTGGTSPFNISKYANTGSLTWSYTNSSISVLGSPSTGYLTMAVDKSANCYFTSPSNNYTEYFTAEISAAGGLVWSAIYGTAGTGGSSGIAIYTPVGRLGQIEYPEITVTGNSFNGAYFTTMQYTYQPVNNLSYSSDSLTGFGNIPSNALTERLSNYPNPFRGNTTIAYTLTNDSHVTLQVYDQSGKLVSVVFEGDQQAGTYRQPFTSSRLAAGIYHYRIVATSPQGNFIQTKEMLIR
jgi:hypothetical protein